MTNAGNAARTMVTQSELSEHLRSAENRALVLETILDMEPGGAVTVLEALACICHAKADHLMENWQDDDMSGDWARIGRRIGAVCDSGAFRELVRRIGGRF